jgi:hypothetical protein
MHALVNSHSDGIGLHSMSIALVHVSFQSATKSGKALELLWKIIVTIIEVCLPVFQGTVPNVTTKFFLPLFPLLLGSSLGIELLHMGMTLGEVEANKMICIQNQVILIFDKRQQHLSQILCLGSREIHLVGLIFWWLISKPCLPIQMRAIIIAIPTHLTLVHVHVGLLHLPAKCKVAPKTPHNNSLAIFGIFLWLEITASDGFLDGFVIIFDKLCDIDSSTEHGIFLVDILPVGNCYAMGLLLAIEVKIVPVSDTLLCQDIAKELHVLSEGRWLKMDIILVLW